MKKRSLKGIIAVFLAVIMLFGVFPKLNVEAATNKVKLGKSEKTAGIIKSLGSVYYATTPEGDSSYRYLKFKTKNFRGYYRIKITNVSVLGSIDADVPGTDGCGYYCYKGKSIIIDQEYEKNTWVYIRICTNSEDLKGKIKIQVFPRADKEGYSKKHSTKLTINKIKKARMDGHDDYDYFKFTAPVSARYQISLKNVNINSSARLRFTVFDADGKTMTYSWGINKGNTENKMITMIKGKTYYIEVTNYGTSIPNVDWHVGYRGDYTLKISK